MKKYIIFFLMIIVVPLGAEIVINIGACYKTGLNFDDSTYGSSFNYPDVAQYTEMNTTVFDGGSGIGFNGGFTYYFNYSLGFGIDFSYSNLSYDATQDFTWAWTWWDNSGSNREKSWTGSGGSISVVPISMNLKYRNNITESLKVIISGGLTAFMCSSKLTGHVGVALDPFLDEGYWLLDFIDYDVESKVSETKFGGNIGIEFEYAMSDFVGIYFRGRYYLTSKFSGAWTVLPGTFTGDLGRLINEISQPIEIEEYTWEVNVNALSVMFGITIYL